ncbi:MAG: cupin domain-containing protein [Candidatus Aerophobetes bacterium]|nr:cupin domain-containing protein [Candidatus Aerophobetes bacterium]
MKINQNSKIKEIEVTEEGAKDVRKKVLVGSDDGSKNIIMRYFTILPEGHSPKHTHNYEHLVKIERGKGIVIGKDGSKAEVSEGHSIFVEANEPHQFQNPFKENFEFICIIPKV